MKNYLTCNQASYFDNQQRQYNHSLLLNPPLHSQLEITRLLEKIPRGIIADFGAGTGRFTIPLLKHGFRVMAVDISQKSLNTLQITAKKLGLLKNLRTNNELIENYKAIVGSDILHHVDLTTTLSEIWSHLQDGGRIVFSEPNGGNLFWYIYITLVLDWKAEKGILSCNYYNLLAKLKKAGYANIEVIGVGWLPRPLFSWSKKMCLLNDWLGNLPIIKLFSYRLMITAQK